MLTKKCVSIDCLQSVQTLRTHQFRHTIVVERCCSYSVSISFVYHDSYTNIKQCSNVNDAKLKFQRAGRQWITTMILIMARGMHYVPLMNGDEVDFVMFLAETNF